MPLDPALVAETRAWLIKARRDLEAADFEMTAMPPFTGDAVFHAQQVAEKTLKAFLVWHGRIFRKTHNLVELGEECASIEFSVEPLLRRAAPLTEYAWKYRYPGEPDEPSREEAGEALSIAREVHTVILAMLPDDVRP
ncbi:MAG TPA: HEPN domain-containing protein [Thermoanaerobaculia bacterium]|nr:HEPN domain-containing protein [Thermoanaerobaculia bacterium]